MNCAFLLCRFVWNLRLWSELPSKYVEKSSSAVMPWGQGPGLIHWNVAKGQGEGVARENPDAQRRLKRVSIQCDSRNQSKSLQICPNLSSLPCCTLEKAIRKSSKKCVHLWILDCKQVHFWYSQYPIYVYRYPSPCVSCANPRLRTATRLHTTRWRNINLCTWHLRKGANRIAQIRTAYRSWDQLRHRTPW